MVPFPAKERLGKLRQLMSQVDKVGQYLREGFGLLRPGWAGEYELFQLFSGHHLYPPHPLCGGRR